MALVGDLSANDLARLIHAHAAHMMGAENMQPQQAMRRACELAVICFDERRLAEALRNSAKSLKTQELLADLVLNGGSGATQALAAPDDDNAIG